LRCRKRSLICRPTATQKRQGPVDNGPIIWVKLAAEKPQRTNCASLRFAASSTALRSRDAHFGCQPERSSAPAVPQKILGTNSGQVAFNVDASDPTKSVRPDAAAIPLSGL